MNTPAQPRPHLQIAGAGLAGALLALLLAQRGLRVTVYERRADPRLQPADDGRSINLALAARGIRALEGAGIMPLIRPLLVAMRGRQVHEHDGSESFHAYGQRSDELNWSVSRAALNRALIDAACAQPGVEVRFGTRCLGWEPDPARLRLRDEATGREFSAGGTPLIGADGGGSAVRRGLAAAGLVSVREDLLDHDYKELQIEPAAARGVLEPNALHIWPRGGFMLIALPNTDGSFTATLFLARTGAGASFESLHDEARAHAFFAREFPGALRLIPDAARQMLRNPQGLLGTIHCDRWYHGDTVLLGDAAHAIVPFHGQGMNCAFEDCVELAQLAAAARDARAAHDWSATWAEFQRRRQPNSDAIAQMALENYVEMRDTVLDPHFQRRRELARLLELRHPGRFIPRYSMVQFHPEIPYAEALRRGTAQERILDELLGAQAQASTPDSIAPGLLEQADRLLAALPLGGEPRAAGPGTG